LPLPEILLSKGPSPTFLL